jgi:hypothetical protein
MTRRNLFSDDADMTTVQATIKRMTKQLQVVVEAGVLRPLEPLPFAERQHLLVTVTDETTGGRAFNPRDRAGSQG